MPFTTPFRGWYTKGDLLYGLRPARTQLVLHFGAAILSVPGGAGAVTVDQFRYQLVKNGGGASGKEFGEFLRANKAHPKYSNFFHAIQPHGVDEEAFSEAELRADLQNAAWRSKSKFGLEWVLSGQKGHIHFVLDQIDMAAVVTKTHLFTHPTSGEVLAQDSPRGKSDGSPKERTITHSELRWIYRNRANPLVSAAVQFWYTPNGGRITTCRPPWDETGRTTILPSGTVKTWQEAWKIYKPTTERDSF